MCCYGLTTIHVVWFENKTWISRKEICFSLFFSLNERLEQNREKEERERFTILLLKIMLHRMYTNDGCFKWKYIKRVIPLEFRVGLQAGAVTAISCLKSLVTCMNKFEEQDSVAVFRFTDEKTPPPPSLDEDNPTTSRDVKMGQSETFKEDANNNESVATYS